MDITREQWLQVAVEEIRKAVYTVQVPEVQVSCSWPGGGSPAKRIGECWPRAASGAKVNEVFISPKLSDGLKVVSILAHELAHAVDDCKSGHRAGFTKIGRLMGLEGKATCMQPTAETAMPWLLAVEKRVGKYPHRTLDGSKSGKKKQTARMLKGECNDCKAVWRMSAVHMINVTQCPCCGSDHLTLDGPKDAETETDE